MCFGLRLSSPATQRTIAIDIVYTSYVTELTLEYGTILCTHKQSIGNMYDLGTEEYVPI